MAHRHREGRVGPGLGVQPDVGELRGLAVVGGDHDALRPLVAGLGVEVSIGRAGLGHVGAPEDQEHGVVPVGALGHVGLLAPGLRRARGQVAVPVVERERGAADEREVAHPGRVGDHRHRGDRREPADPVRPVLPHRVHVGRGDDLVDLFPGRADEAAQAAHRLIGAPPLGVLDDSRPRIDGRPARSRLAPHPQQPPAHHRVLEAVAAVEVPGVARAARAPARLVVGHLRPRARVVGLLGLPGDDAALDVDLPAAPSGAVDPVRGAHDLVVLPAVAVALLPGAALGGHHAVPIGERAGPLSEEQERVREMAHRDLSRAGIGISFSR